MSVICLYVCLHVCLFVCLFQVVQSFFDFISQITLILALKLTPLLIESAPIDADSFSSPLDSDHALSK